MKFPYRIYFLNFLIPIILLVVVLGIIVIDILSLTKAIPINMISSIPVAAFHALIIIFIPPFGIAKLSKSYSLAKEKETDALITQGVIQNIIKPHEIGDIGKYRLNGRFVRAKYILIGDVKYYCMCADGLEIGMSVEIKYLPTSKYVLELKII